MDIVREPKQQRAIVKKEKIIKAGFDLICKNGYHNTNTAEIAKKANVSTGIVYQYFKDKHDIFMEAIKMYGDKIFFPTITNSKFTSIEDISKRMISEYVNDHKISSIAHEEIMAMVHSDHEVAEYYYKREIDLTNNIKELLINNNYVDNNLYEKVHIMIGMIDNLCHEIIYHKHNNMNYTIMTEIVIKNINELFKNDLMK